MPKSALFDYMKRKPRAAKGRPTALRIEEKRTIIEALHYFADCCVHLTRNEIVEAIELLVSTFPSEWKQALPFKDGKPGRAFDLVAI